MTRPREIEAGGGERPYGRLYDGIGRRLEYLRLSLTDVCNFRCAYCLPDGYAKPCDRPSELSIDEARRAVSAFAALGLWKVRLTGGEPSLRRDFDEMAHAIAEIPGIRRVAMTTNGYRLAKKAGDWRTAGISAINVSVDSLDPARFAAITGQDRLGLVLDGIEAARAAGFESLKINVVLMRGINDCEIDDLIDFVSERDLSLRFIEVMRTNDTAEFFAKRHLAGQSVVDRLELRGWSRLPREPGAGPAIEFAHEHSSGRIGIIAPYAKDFCAICNRLRISSQGKLHLCLFGDRGIDLRPLLQSDDERDELCDLIRRLTATKSSSHRLHQGDSGATPHLASIGG